MIKSFERGFSSERHSARPDSHREKAGNNNQGRGAPPGPPGDDQLKSRVEALEKVNPKARAFQIFLPLALAVALSKTL